MARFQMKQKMLAIGDDFWIENDDGDRVYKGRREGDADPRHLRARGPRRTRSWRRSRRRSSPSATR